jgi:thioesterase domain-containing protein
VQYAFPATLLRAREGATRISDRPDLGWSEICAELRVEWVNGRHETMLEPRFADDVAAHIVAALG